MLYEDKLTHTERVRLEALAQAVESMPGCTASTIVPQARQFEAFILDRTTDNA